MEQAQQPTHFVIYYKETHQVAVEPKEKLVHVPPDFYSLLASDSCDEIPVAVLYGDTLYDGVVITACAKETADNIYNVCYSMVREKRKSLKTLLGAFPRIVPMSKRLSLPNWTKMQTDPETGDEPPKKVPKMAAPECEQPEIASLPEDVDVTTFASPKVLVDEIHYEEVDQVSLKLYLVNMHSKVSIYHIGLRMIPLISLKCCM